VGSRTSYCASRIATRHAGRPRGCVSAYYAYDRIDTSVGVCDDTPGVARKLVVGNDPCTTPPGGRSIAHTLTGIGTRHRRQGLTTCLLVTMCPSPSTTKPDPCEGRTREPPSVAAAPHKQHASTRTHTTHTRTDRHAEQSQRVHMYISLRLRACKLVYINPRVLQRNSSHGVSALLKEGGGAGHAYRAERDPRQERQPPDAGREAHADVSHRKHRLAHRCAPVRQNLHAANKE
jgi:hypothetical protein